MRAAVLRKWSRTEKLMGNRFTFTIVAPEEAFAQRAIDAVIAEVARIEALLTTYSDSSVTAAINAAAGRQPVEVPREVFNLLSRSVRISSLTQGAFDITYGSVDKRFWNFDTAMATLPDAQTAKAAVRLINYRNIVLDEGTATVFLKERGMRIGFGAIGKGYAAEGAAAALKKMGIAAGVVNAAGDLLTWGLQPGGKPWTIGVADPDQRGSVFSTFEISGLAVATSGNYEKFATIGGRRYSHTIDPKTGFPITGIKSATIICKNAELADALTTPVMIMGVSAGLSLINQMKDIACVLVEDNGRIHTSKNIKIT